MSKSVYKSNRNTSNAIRFAYGKNQTESKSVMTKYKTLEDCGKDVANDKLLFCVLKHYNPEYNPETIELNPAFVIDETLNLTYNPELLVGITELNRLMSYAGAISVDDNVYIYTIPILLVCTTNKKENHATIIILYNRKIYNFGLSNYTFEQKYYCRVVLPDDNLNVQRENTVKIIVPFFDCISSTYLTYINKHFLHEHFIPKDPRQSTISIPLDVPYHRYNSIFNPVSWGSQNCSTFATIGIPSSTSRLGTFSIPASIQSYLCIFNIPYWNEILKLKQISFNTLNDMNEKLLFCKSVGLGIKNKTKKTKRKNTIKLEKERRLRRRRQKSQKK
jgi:hypothetical protein